MEMKLKYYMEILGIKDIHDVTDESVRSAYKKIAIITHPDKPGGNAELFIQATDAKNGLIEFLSAKTFSRSVNMDNCSDGGCDDMKWFGDVFKKKDVGEINQVFRKMVGGVTVRLFDAMGDVNMLHTYELFVKYRDMLCIDESVLEEIKKKISERSQTFILNPTIDDLFGDNVYRLNHKEGIINIPLWHSELYYDMCDGEMVVKCVPILDDDTWISGNNDIHTCVTVDINMGPDGILCWDGGVDVSIGKRSFFVKYEKLLIKRNQVVVFKEAGPARINTRNMYDVSDRSDVHIHIKINSFGVMPLNI